MPIHNRLRNIRESQGKSVREVAREIGMDPTHLSYIERGIRGCTDERKLAFARYFDVPVTELFFIEEVEGVA